MSTLGKIWKNRWMIRALIPSLIFNFRKLPLSQAAKLPILLYKPNIRKNSGKILINAPVRFGMIRMGYPTVDLFPDNGIVISNQGVIVFNGTASIGHNSAISVGRTGRLELGDNFGVTTGLKLACYHSVRIEDNVLTGWNVQITDTDFHALKEKTAEGKKYKSYGPVVIGRNVWIASGCKIYKNTSVPHSCVVGADTILHKPIGCAPNSLITNEITTTVIKTGIFFDHNDNLIDYDHHEA